MNRMLYSAASIAAVSLGLLIAQASGPYEAPQIKGDPGGRYLTHITTDKPIYRTGEKLYVRAVVLRANGHTPMTVPERRRSKSKDPKATSSLPALPR